MLDTTKLSMATVAALLNSSISIDVPYRDLRAHAPAGD
jgi:hypothetical protein